MEYPTTDFNRVRDGRQVPPLSITIDLSVARSRTNNTQMEIVAAGNAFYCDQDIATGGVSKITFQHKDYTNYDIPFTVSPGFTARSPFTRFMLENDAQPGKKATLFYGVDIDFTPGQSGAVTISGGVEVAQGSALSERGFNTTSGATVQIAPPQAGRKRIIFRNLSTTLTVYLRGDNSLLQGAIPLGPGEAWVETDAAPAEWFVYSPSGVAAMNIQEAA